MLRSIDFKTMPYLFTDKAGTCLTVEFDGRELDDIYAQVKAMYDLEPHHKSDSDMPTEPGWYATRDGEDLLSYDGDILPAYANAKRRENSRQNQLIQYRLQGWVQPVY